MRRSLAESFQPENSGPHRAAELANLLPPPPNGAQHLAATPCDAAASPVATQDDVVAATRDEEADRVRNVAIYLPVELLTRLRRTARSRELTYAELLVEAASAHLDEVARQFDVPHPPTAGPGMPSRAKRRTPEPGVQVQMRLDGHQIAWLDEQADRLGAPSRTAMVSALLRAHLGESTSG